MLQSMLGLSNEQVSAKFKGLAFLFCLDVAKLEPRFKLLQHLTGWTGLPSRQGSLCYACSLQMSAFWLPSALMKHLIAPPFAGTPAPGLAKRILDSPILLVYPEETMLRNYEAV